MDPWKFWTETLGSPKFVLAPMVDHSELPWRMLSREFGCQLVYTPMFHAANFANSRKYRERNFATCPEDRPLIVQFCANDPDTLLAAARHVEQSCDGIDINLGCPQEIARRGHYGAFLQDEWQLIGSMIKKLRNNLDSRVAISCKIRRFDQLSKTVEYAKFLEDSGCSFVAIHARTREQRGCLTGAADWSHIKAVKEALEVPVIANGNIQSLADAEECMEATKADAVMTAEGNLYNPAIFLGLHPPAWQVAAKYLSYVRRYPVACGMAKSHLFKLFHRCISVEENADLRAKIGESKSIDELEQAVELFKVRYGTEEEQTLAITRLPVPMYLCQPRFRYSATENDDSSSDDPKKKPQKRMKTNT